MFDWILDALVMGGGKPGLIAAVQLSYVVLLLIYSPGAWMWWLLPVVLVVPWVVYARLRR